MPINLSPSKNFMEKFAKNPPKPIGKKEVAKGSGKVSRLAKAFSKKK